MYIFETEIHLKLIIGLVSFFCMLTLAPLSAIAADKTFNLGGGKIDVSFTDGVAQQNYKLTRNEVLAWIETSASAVAKYFKRFPVKNLNLSIAGGASGRINGVAYNGSQPLIIINLQAAFDQHILSRDWVLVHEMVHLSFPPVHRRHQWLLEGLATYVEPIVRVRAGLLSEDDAWKWLIKGTPKGLPESGNRGLDFTPTWGQRYWGGAIFFLVADIKIHQQTNNKLGIEHALREIQRKGGSMQLEHNWEVIKALSIGDQATGTSVLVDLYNEMKDKPVMTNLEAIWDNLGVKLQGNKIIYNEDAKSAELRRSMMQE